MLAPVYGDIYLFDFLRDRNVTVFKSMESAKLPLSRMKLICAEGPEKDAVWELSSSRTSIGRGPICDIIIKDLKASRIHAEIILEGNDFVFHDKESLNGSFINNDRVTQQVLVPGDQIRIGKTTLHVLEAVSYTHLRAHETS